MIRLLLVLSVICLTFICLPACDTAPEIDPATEKNLNLEDDVNAINEVRSQQLATWNAGDLTGFIAVVADDAVLYPPNSPVLVGKESIKSWCEAALDNYTFKMTYLVDELVVEGNWAFDRGLWTEKVIPKKGGEQIEVPFGIIQLYQRQPNGSWKLARAIWNNNKPVD